MKSFEWTAVYLLSILIHINKQRELAACGKLQTIDSDSRITFGRDTHRWPWHAAIYHQLSETDPTYKCGGTLLGSKFVLTAAHCVSVAAEQVSVSLGRLYLNESHNSAPFIKVAEILRHPDYNTENFENDIAVITLSTYVIFNSSVQPICMWNADKIDLSAVIGKFGTVVGWGLTENGETSNTLQAASLPVVQSLKCLRSNRNLFGQFLTDTNFCAGTRNGTSVCTGDSGGSMMFQEGETFYIRGIVSVGGSQLDQRTNKFMCDSMQYAIFTDVAQYLPWISEITKTIECETVVRCDWIGGIDICTLILTLEEPERKCKIIFDEMSSEAVKWVDVFEDGSTDVPDLSNAVDKFTKLETLKLHQFKLVERSTLSPFRNILWLSLHRFSFSQLEADTFVDLNNLEQLHISDSELMTIPAGIFRNNTKIRKLVLSSNHLTELHPDVFENNRNVEQLFLLNNKLDTLPANIFRNNEKMRELYLNLNHLKEVPEDLFNRLTKLEALLLSFNQIESLPPRLFRRNLKLASVDLSNNNIKRVEVDLTTMPQLRIFYLSGNPCIDENFTFPERSLSQANEIIRKNCTN